MRTEVTVIGGSDPSAELASLFNWLNRDDFQGHVDIQRKPMKPGEMGAISDTLAVTLGAGGAGTALINSIALWIRMRRSAVRLKIRATNGVEIELSADNVENLENIIERFGQLTDQSQ
jgi:Effector Associated Constant Component 1